MAIFKIFYAGEITVYHQDKIFLVTKINNKVKTKLTFYRGDKVILISRLFSFFIWRRVTIDFQNLPLPIEFYKQVKMLRFMMSYGSNVIKTIQRLSKEKAYQLILNEKEVAVVTVTHPVTIGYDEYELKSTVDDDETNLYLLFALLIQMTPT